MKPMIDDATAHRPAVAVAIEDARQHLRRAASAIRAAASLDPGAAPNLATVHAVVADQLDALNALRVDASH